MKPLKEYDIQFVGLKLGKHHFDYQIDKKFFEDFEFDEFNDVNVKVNLVFEKKSTLLELDFESSGIVNVNCDTTNEPYDQAIEDDFNLVVNFGDEYNDEDENILIVPHGEFEINVAQYIYELIILAMPIKRIHPGIEDGTLKSEILTKLEELSPKNLEEQEESEEIDPRWNTLKKLLTDK
ncbi:DUF177 domain-containing protein [Gelidibacter sp.]|uniref:YceD family protein n=1 Tax=Gelidibacter sp. TaxID=2018083 RepID=UPI002BB7D4D7|nr:DUF177 domain-containing protein [Gelidibacter sp.]HUH28241.1 DUF177 domain-containing protein [Gelidibacter sp.]